MRPFTIVYSNLTMRLFAWEGTPKSNKKYLGNREIMGSVKASSVDEALSNWKCRNGTTA